MIKATQILYPFKGVRWDTLSPRHKLKKLVKA
jgi:hypothetical protein